MRAALWRALVGGRSALSSREAQRGSALIELTWLGIVLLIPVVYIVLTVFDAQRGAFGATAAARSAARAYALADDDASGRTAAQEAARLAFDDQGLDRPVEVEITCTVGDTAGDAADDTVDTAPPVTGDPCRQPGSVITVAVASSLRLPAVPKVLGGAAPTIALEAEHTVPYGRFREGRG